MLVRIRCLLCYRSLLDCRVKWTGEHVLPLVRHVLARGGHWHGTWTH